MKKIILLYAFSFFWNLSKAQTVVSFMVDKNPIQSISHHLNSKIKVFGFVRRIKIDGGNKTIVVGSLGDQANSLNYKAEISVTIQKSDRNKFEKIKDSELVKNWVVITGRVVKLNKRIVLMLENLNDIDFTNIKGGPIIK